MKRGLGKNFFSKKFFPKNPPHLTLQILAQRDGASDDAGDNAETHEAEENRISDLLESEDGDHLQVGENHRFNVGIDVPFREKGNDGRKYTNNDAFKNERQSDKPAGCTDIAHDADFMPSCKDGQFDGVDNDEHTDHGKDRKEPYEHQHDAALDAFDAGRKVETVVDLHDAFDLVKLIVQFADLFGIDAPPLHITAF